MKNKIIGLVFALLMLFAFVPCIHAAEIVDSGECGAQGDNVTWTLNSDGTLTISGEGDMMMWDKYSSASWNNYISDIKIIKIENGVTSIGSHSFVFCQNLQKIYIPDSMNVIGVNAFAWCSKLKEVYIDSLDAWCGITFSDSKSTPLSSNAELYINNNPANEITLPDSVTEITEYMFSHCTSLTKINIPSNVYSIDMNAFDSCNNLTNITVDSDNQIYASDNGVLFDKHKTSLIFCPQGKKGSYAIPESVITINENSFYDSLLTKVFIPEGVIHIGKHAFKGSHIESIDIPDSVTEIDTGAFSFCVSLKQVDLSKNITEIKDSTFTDCYKLKYINIKDKVTLIGSCAFASANFTEIQLPKNITTISNDAFYYCKTLSDIYYDGTSADWNRINIGNDNSGYFTNAEKHYNSVLITSLQLDKDSLSLKVGETGNLNAAIMPNNSTIRDVEWTSSNETVAIVENGVITAKSVGMSVITAASTLGYYNDVCTVTVLPAIDISGKCGDNLEWSLVGDTLTISGTGDMQNYSTDTPWGEYSEYIEKIVLNDKITSIGDYSFCFCTNLTDISLPYGITKIGDCAFADCESIKTLHIPNSLVSIGKEAFNNCIALKSVSFSGEKTEWDNILIGEHNEPLMSSTIYYNSTEITSSGKCGDNLTWVLNADGVFTVSGTGEMWNSDNLENYDSWKILPNGIKKVVISDGVTSIGAGAFLWSPLESVDIAESVVNIGKCAFYQCKNLTKITIPDSVVSIGESAFMWCDNLREVRIPDSIVSIEPYTFAYSNTIEEIYIPDGINSIGMCAFKDCYKLKTIYLPKTVTEIDKLAFFQTVINKDIYYARSEEYWDNIQIGEQYGYLPKDMVHFNAIGLTSPTIASVVCGIVGVSPQINVNLTDTAYDSTMITAFYKNGVLVDIQTTLVSANDVEKTVPVTNADADTAKVMIWSDLNSMKPLCDAKSVNLNEGEL